MARILIVDDDPDIVFTTGLFLKKAQHEVLSASNREDGMKAIEQQNPDLIILDVMMEQPDDGIAMAQELRRQGNETPILMLTSVARVTGFAYDQDQELVPVDAFHEKPIQPETLLATVEQLLVKRQQEC
ncbi:MAG TPA: response regulator [Vicinamibacterales bacterium]|nr:response regulator [Vicinamibacterales bacterium]